MCVIWEMVAVLQLKTQKRIQSHGFAPLAGVIMNKWMYTLQQRHLANQNTTRNVRNSQKSKC